MKTKSILLCVMMATVSFAGCLGNNDTIITEEGDPVVPGELPDDWPTYYVATANDLPTCDANTLGRLYYVESDVNFQACGPSGWEIITLESVTTTVSSSDALQSQIHAIPVLDVYDCMYDEDNQPLNRCVKIDFKFGFSFENDALLEDECWVVSISSYSSTSEDETAYAIPQPDDATNCDGRGLSAIVGGTDFDYIVTNTNGDYVWSPVYPVTMGNCWHVRTMVWNVSDLIDYNGFWKDMAINVDNYLDFCMPLGDEAIFSNNMNEEDEDQIPSLEVFTQSGAILWVGYHESGISDVCLDLNLNDNNDCDRDIIPTSNIGTFNDIEYAELDFETNIFSNTTASFNGLLLPEGFLGCRAEGIAPYSVTITSNSGMTHTDMGYIHVGGGLVGLSLTDAINSIGLSSEDLVGMENECFSGHFTDNTFSVSDHKSWVTNGTDTLLEFEYINFNQEINLADIDFQLVSTGGNDFQCDDGFDVFCQLVDEDGDGIWEFGETAYLVETNPSLCRPIDLGDDYGDNSDHDDDNQISHAVHCSSGLGMADWVWVEFTNSLTGETISTNDALASSFDIMDISITDNSEILDSDVNGLAIIHWNPHDQFLPIEHDGHCVVSSECGDELFVEIITEDSSYICNSGTGSITTNECYFAVIGSNGNVLDEWVIDSEIRIREAGNNIFDQPFDAEIRIHLPSGSVISFTLDMN